jgi:hypothetical protein
MMKRHILNASTIALALAEFVLAAPAGAEITDIEIRNVSPAFEGHSFANTGTYTLIEGVAHGALDPTNPLNAEIAGLEEVPRTEGGLVQYSVDFAIAKPERNGNGALLYSVLNRGRKLDVYFLNNLPNPTIFTNDLLLEHVGDGLLMEEGFTLVWSGWDGGVQPGGGRMTADFPVALAAGQPREGVNLAEATDTGTDPVFQISLPQPAANLDESAASLTVRQLEADPRSIPADLSFTYVDDETLEVTRPAGYDSGAIYEFIYPALDFTRIKDEIGNEIDRNGVLGIGFASVRDLVSYLREGLNPENPLNEMAFDRALIYGYSQAGRMIKDFIYQGFNEDEGGSIVFDGAMPVVSGAAKTYVNERFAKPGNFTTQHRWHLQPGDQFPFAYNIMTDPISGENDGILMKCLASNTCPKVVHVDSDAEIRNRRASLVVTDPLGKSDLMLPENVRVYWVASSPHVPLEFSRLSSELIKLPGLFGGEPKNYASPIDQRPVQRALFLALDRWVVGGTPPPPSVHGKIADGTLVPMTTVVSQFPDAIPDFTFTDNYNAIQRTDYVLREIPEAPYELGEAYNVLFTSVDEDGNELAGVRLPAVQRPIGTYAGWNPRAAGHAEDDLNANSGGWVPFARTVEARNKSGDPRLSLEERYGTSAAWAEQIEDAAEQLVDQGYLLQRDADEIAREAADQDIMTPR